MIFEKRSNKILQIFSIESVYGILPKLPQWWRVYMHVSVCFCICYVTSLCTWFSADDYVTFVYSNIVSPNSDSSGIKLSNIALVFFYSSSLKMVTDILTKKYEQA